MQGFKTFILRGNVVSLAVGVVIGAAFNSVVSSFTSSFLTPIIAALTGNEAFADLNFKIMNATFPYGVFLNALISFAITASVVYFFVVVPMNKLEQAMQRGGETPDPTTKKCPYCITEISLKATRCPNCTSEFTESKSKK